MRVGRIYAFCVVVAVVAGCDGAGGGDDGGGPSGVLVSAADGGAIASADGIFTLIVPPGALAEDTTFTIAPLAAADVPADAVGDAYRVEPSAAVLAIPALAVWTYEGAPSFGGAAVDVRARAGDLVQEPLVAGTIVEPGERRRVLAEVASPGDFWLVASGDGAGLLGDDRAAVVGEAHRRELRVSGARNTRSSAAQWWWGVGTSAPSILEVTGPSEWPRVDDLLPMLARGLFERHGARLGMELVSLSGRAGPGTEVPPGGPADLVGEGEWTCAAPGRALEVGAHLHTHAATATRPEAVTFWLFARHVDCAAPSAPAGGVARLASVQPATLAEGILSPTGIERIEVELVPFEDRVLPRLTPFSGGDVLYEGVTGGFRARAGSPREVRVWTSQQDLTCTFADDAYRVEGVDPRRSLYGRDDDTARWSVGPAEVATPAPARVSILDEIEITPAPPGGTLADVIVSIPAGAAETLVVRGHLAGSAGDSGYWASIATSRLTGTAPGRVEGPLSLSELLDGLASEAAARGLSLTGSIDLGLANRTEDTSLFPMNGPIDFEAARLLRIPVEDLVPPRPPPATEVGCAALPGVFPALDPGATDPRVAIVCIDEAGECRVTNDVDESDPPPASQCLGSARALSLEPSRTDGTPNACVLTEGWRPVWSSRGLDAPTRCMAPFGAVGVEQFFEIERASDGARFRVRFEATGPGEVEVLAVEPAPAGPYPRFGAKHSCLGVPVTFSTPGAGGRPHATIELDNTTSCAPCLITGDWVRTAEPETSCPDAAGFELYGMDVGIPQARFASIGGSAGWSIESASAGTLASAQRLGALPIDVDVTVILGDGTQRWQIVFRLTSTNDYVISSIARL